MARHESGAVGLNELAEELGGKVSAWRKLVLDRRIPFFTEGSRYFMHPKDVLAVVVKDGINVPGLKEEPTELEKAVETVKANVLRVAQAAAIEAMRDEIQSAVSAEVNPSLLAALHRELADMIEALAGAS